MEYNIFGLEMQYPKVFTTVHLERNCDVSYVPFLYISMRIPGMFWEIMEGWYRI